MSSDRLITVVVALVLVAHVVALLWLLRSRNRLVPLLVVNVPVSACILAYSARRLRYILATPPDGQMLALIAFEALALATAGWAFRGRRLAVVVSCLAFALHLCASIAAVVFILTFKMNRMI